jgi:PAS domain-containing protein
MDVFSLYNILIERIYMHVKDNNKGQPINGLKSAEVTHTKRDGLIRKSKEDYQVLFDTIPHGIQEIDTSGKIIFLNIPFLTQPTLKLEMPVKFPQNRLLASRGLLSS